MPETSPDEIITEAKETGTDADEGQSTSAQRTVLRWRRFVTCFRHDSYETLAFAALLMVVLVGAGANLSVTIGDTSYAWLHCLSSFIAWVFGLQITLAIGISVIGRLVSRGAPTPWGTLARSWDAMDIVFKRGEELREATESDRIDMHFTSQGISGETDEITASVTEREVSWTRGDGDDESDIVE